MGSITVKVRLWASEDQKKVTTQLEKMREMLQVKSEIEDKCMCIEG